jgi:CubicO group peptidase (beta-lactamase class C family)
MTASAQIQNSKQRTLGRTLRAGSSGLDIGRGPGDRAWTRLRSTASRGCRGHARLARPEWFARPDRCGGTTNHLRRSADHRSGLTYGDVHRGPIARAYAEALGGQIDNALPPDEWIARLATLPLVDQPGRGFHYGVSTDLLGFLIARLDGAPLSEVLERRIFKPLGMRDTGFVVPRQKRARRADCAGSTQRGA